MTLIKMYFVTVVKRIAAEASEKMAGQVSRSFSSLVVRPLTLAAGSLRNGDERASLYQIHKRRRAPPDPHLRARETRKARASRVQLPAAGMLRDLVLGEEFAFGCAARGGGEEDGTGK